MRLEESYRVLDLDAGATDEEVKNAWRDLTKVWHPDRFGHDPQMQGKAEEKLKAINAAYESIRAYRDGTPHETVARSGKTRRSGMVIALAFAAFYILLRRPTPGGLVLAGILFLIAMLLIRRMLKQ